MSHGYVCGCERVQRVHTGLGRENKYGWSLFGRTQGECKIGGIHAPFMNNWFLLFPMKTPGIVAALSGCIGWGVLWPFKRRLRGPCSVPRVFNGDRTHLRKTPLCPCFSKETKESSSLSLSLTHRHTLTHKCTDREEEIKEAESIKHGLKRMRREEKMQNTEEMRRLCLGRQRGLVWVC